MIKRIETQKAINTFAGSFLLASNPDADQSSDNFHNVSKDKKMPSESMSKADNTMHNRLRHV